MNVLAFETSCDECAVALVNPTKNPRYVQYVTSQMDHIEYAGVVPEVAARAYLKALEHITTDFLSKHHLTPDSIDAIAATCGPGLMGGLLVGAMQAKGLAIGWKKPFIAVNHLEGHLLSPRLDPGVEFPYLALLTSGGHCQLVAVHDHRQYNVISSTLDDAAGEAFDKIARLLNLGFPGGPAVEKAARNGNPKAFELPSPALPARPNNPFPLSFSGLKTAVARLVEKLEPMSEQTVADVAASAQHAIVKQLVWCVQKGLKHSTHINWKAVVVAGGVAANQELRATLSEALHNIPFVAPPLHLCTDNAAMIGWAAYESYSRNPESQVNQPIRPRWPLHKL